MKQILLRGPPGVGKSTLGRMLENALDGTKYLTSGGLVRTELKRDPNLRRCVEKGDLVDSDFIISLMKKELNSLSQQRINMIVLDGFPRKLVELQNWIQYAGSPNLTVALDGDHEMIVKMLTKRLVCEACGRSYNLYSDKFLRPLLPKISGICDQCSGKLVQRDDDTKDAIQTRLQIYQENDNEMKGYLKKHGHEVISWRVSYSSEDFRKLVDIIRSSL